MFKKYEDTNVDILAVLDVRRPSIFFIFIFVNFRSPKMSSNSNKSFLCR